MMSSEARRELLPLFWLLAVGTGVWVSLVVAYRLVGFSVGVSDVKEYIDWSYHLDVHGPFLMHMPGFPAAIWAGRTLSLGLVPDTVIVQLIGYASWVLGLLIVYDLLSRSSPGFRTLGTTLFAFAPIGGVFYASFTAFEVLALTLVFAAVWAGMRRRQWTLILVVGYGLVLHQAYWPIHFGIVLAFVIRGNIPWYCLVLSGVPLLAYHLHMAPTHGHAWFYKGVSEQGEDVYTFFHGVRVTLAGGGLVNLVRGALILIVTIGSMLLFGDSIRRRDGVGLAITATLLLILFLGGRDQALRPVKMAALLLLPLGQYLGARSRPTILQKQWMPAAVLPVLLVAQYAWAYHAYRFFT